MTLILVLLIICIALGLSYAAVRSQFTGLKIQRNADRRISARQAAVTGLTMAIKNMHTSGWGGVGTTLTGALGSDQSFQVTYSVGDPALGPEHAEYEDFPYRVTLLSTGSAVDPDNPTSVATHQIRAVVGLIPRALADEPADWAEMVQHTLYQYTADTFEIDVPFSIEGPVRIQDVLTLGRGYAWSDDARERYLGDLGAMRSAGYPDWRPFNGPLYLPLGVQEAGMESLLKNKMGISVTNTSPKTATGWNHPGEVLSYRIYPGGKVYNVPALGRDQQDVTLEPDPQTNPLGIFYRSGEVRLYDDVTIRGTLVIKNNPGGDVHVFGKNVHFLPLDLPPLEGTDLPVRLPVAVVEDDFRIEPDAGGSVTGLLAIWDDFEVEEDRQADIALAFQGRIVAKRFKIRRRSDWNQPESWWIAKEAEFSGQENGGIAYSPVWLGSQAGLDPEPQLTIKPDPTPVRYHWHNAGDPIYVPHPDDSGLRWDLLEWTENP